jgi:hypothetical protein
MENKQTINNQVYNTGIKWKTIAIIFIILFILETLLFGYLLMIGNKSLELENSCAYNICGEYEAYYYDVYEGVCYCLTDNEIEHEVYIG